MKLQQTRSSSYANISLTSLYSLGIIFLPLQDILFMSLGVLPSVFALSMGGADSGLGTVVEAPVTVFIPNSVSSVVRARLPRISVYFVQ